MSEGLGLRLVQSEDSISLKLPTLPNQSPKSITGEQLAELLRSAGSRQQFDKILILDARFGYEYDGGHITGAENVYLPNQQEAVKEKLVDWKMGDRVCVVIHCEFSSHRGPRLFHLLRKFDRELNTYPHLSFPEMYLLHGGYKEFYGKFPEWCTRGYVPMHDQDYKKLCSQAISLTRSRSSAKLRGTSRSESSRLVCPFGSREILGDDDDLAASSSHSDPLSRRVIVSSGGFQDSIFSISSPGSQSGEMTMDTSSDTDEEEDPCQSSPASSRFRSRFNPATAGRSSAPPRSATLHNIPMRATFNRSTSDLYHFPEAEEEAFQGPYTSRS
jgi:rhodanese-related sulfurtransferase